MLYGIGPDGRMFTVTKSYLHREMDRGAKEAGVPVSYTHLAQEHRREHHGGPCKERGLSLFPPASGKQIKPLIF